MKLGSGRRRDHRGGTDEILDLRVHRTLRVHRLEHAHRAPRERILGPETMSAQFYQSERNGMAVMGSSKASQM